MSVEFTQIFVRPDTNTPWFHETEAFTPEHLEYTRTTYKYTGKWISNMSVSEDGLILTQTHTFTTPEDYAEFSSDPRLSNMLIQRTTYNEANNIYSFV